MPPRIDLNTATRITYDTAVTNLIGTDWTVNTVTDTVTDNYNHIYPKFITSEDLKDFSEKLISKLYRIISEHTKIDISEEDFINLLEE